jgi:hypothetical protein
LAQHFFGDLMNVSASLGSLAGAVWQPFLGKQRAWAYSHPRDLAGAHSSVLALGVVNSHYLISTKTFDASSVIKHVRLVRQKFVHLPIGWPITAKGGIYCLFLAGPPCGAFWVVFY